MRRDRTVHLDGERYEVPAEDVDRKVDLRFDLGKPDKRRVDLYDKGVLVQPLRRLDLVANTRVQRTKDRPLAQPTPTGMSFGELMHKAHADLVAGAAISPLPGVDGDNAGHDHNGDNSGDINGDNNGCDGSQGGA